MKFVRAATEGPGSHVDHLREAPIHPRLTPETRLELAGQMEEFLRTFAQEMGSNWFNRELLHLTNPGWISMGLLFHDLYVTMAGDLDVAAREALVRLLANVDWRPSNPDLVGLLGEAGVDKEGKPLVDSIGRQRIGRFYGGARAYTELHQYMRKQIGIDRSVGSAAVPPSSQEPASVTV